MRETEVMVGQIWRDMDKRMGGRRCKVESLLVRNGRLCARMARVDSNNDPYPTMPRTWIWTARMRPINGGWTLDKELTP